MTNKSIVSVLYTKPESVISDYDRLFHLAGGSAALDKKSTTILKDNISWHLPMPSANTTPWQLEASILTLQKAGFKDLVCVQNDTVVVSSLRGEDLNGYRPIFNQYQIPVLYNYKPEDIRWIEYKPKGKLLALDRVFPDGIFIPEYFLGKNIVHLPTVKCHIYTTITGAIKNAFGGLLNTNRHYAHSWIHESIVDLLTIQKEIHSGIFAIMDGTTAGNGQGPRTMIPEVKNIILASADQVAIDAVSARLMGFDPMSIPFIRLAHERGLGTADPRQIELVGDDITDVNWHFKVGSNFHTFLAWLAWYGPTKVFQKLVLHTPLVAIPNFISYFNHDHIQWPLKYRLIYEEWRKNTAWGKLFDRYQQDGYLVGKTGAR
jgi:uncharacterized protein (DUF362 family)